MKLLKAHHSSLIDSLESRVLFALSYGVTDYGPLATDDAGLIIGNANGRIATSSGFIYTKSGVTNLDSTSYGTGENQVGFIQLTSMADDGTVAGTYLNINNSTNRAFTFKNNQWTYLDTLFGLTSKDPLFNVVISPDGVLAGNYTPNDTSQGTHFFRYMNGTFSDLGPATGLSNIQIKRVNDTGTFVGQAFSGSTGDQFRNAFIFDTSIHLFAPSNSTSPSSTTDAIFNDINAAGQVAGWQTPTPGSATHHVITANGSSLVDLTPAGNADSHAINSDGNIIAGRDEATSAAAIFTGGQTIELDSILNTAGNYKTVDAFRFDSQDRLAVEALKITASTAGPHLILLTPGGSDNGGGGGGGSGTATLTPVAVKDTVPDAVVSGDKIKGAVTLSITNSTAAAINGRTSIDIYATITGAIDSASKIIGSIAKTLSLKASQSKTVSVNLKPFSLATGIYTLISRTTTSAGAATDATTGPTITAAQPFVNVAAVVGTVAPAQVIIGKTSAKFKISLTNTGNIDAKGPATFAIGLSTNGTSLSIPLTTTKKSLKLKAGGKAATVTLSFKIPRTTTVTNGSYFAWVDFTLGSATLSIASPNAFDAMNS